MLNRERCSQQNGFTSQNDNDIHMLLLKRLVDSEPSATVMASYTVGTLWGILTPEASHDRQVEYFCPSAHQTPSFSSQEIAQTALLFWFLITCRFCSSREIRLLIPRRYNSRSNSPAARGMLSLPGLIRTSNNPKTGRWSDVFTSGQEAYFRTLISPFWRLLYTILSV